jgi:hypothetical protein
MVAGVLSRIDIEGIRPIRGRRTRYLSEDQPRSRSDVVEIARVPPHWFADALLNI